MATLEFPNQTAPKTYLPAAYYLPCLLFCCSDLIRRLNSLLLMLPSANPGERHPFSNASLRSSIMVIARAGQTPESDIQRGPNTT